MLEPGHPFRIFLLGVVGSIAVEAWKINRAFESGRRLPTRYKSVGFWVVRGVLALIGGVLAVAYNIQGDKADIIAIHIGASASALISTFARQAPALPNDKAGSE
jgi:hypothetical protein